MKRKFVIGGIILLAVAGYLVYLFLGSSLSYYATVSEFLKNRTDQYGESVRVGGTIVENSIEWEPQKPELKFDIADEHSQLSILYEGVIPDNFAAGKDIVIEGKYNPDGIFYAESLLLKCPSKYSPQD